ncbi:hypothetical protein [Pseudorhodoferax sp.]|uniref:hypothetical protein n=1 Tax=Pseudorhodoferax sp. TaxID=1993553 RepID=UPI002DD64B42|nr:hypothetical protein [Pseudorhodoferax sp.]
MTQRLAALATALLLAGCDGYPTEDAPRLDESALSVPQLLQSLDQVGARSHLRARYRHALAPGCVLEVRADNDEALRVPLDGAEITTRLTDEDAPDHEVLVYARGQTRGDDAPAIVQQGGRWVDWVQTRSLLQQLQRRCAEDLRSPSGSDPR